MKGTRQLSANTVGCRSECVVICGDVARIADLFKHLLCNLHGGVAATESRCAPHRPAVAPSHIPSCRRFASFVRWHRLSAAPSTIRASARPEGSVAEQQIHQAGADALSPFWPATPHYLWRRRMRTSRTHVNRLGDAVCRNHRSLPSRCSCPRAPLVGPAAAKAAASHVAKLTFLGWWYMKGHAAAERQYGRLPIRVRRDLRRCRSNRRPVQTPAM